MGEAAGGKKGFCSSLHLIGEHIGVRGRKGSDPAPDHACLGGGLPSAATLGGGNKSGAAGLATTWGLGNVLGIDADRGICEDGECRSRMCGREGKGEKDQAEEMANRLPRSGITESTVEVWLVPKGNDT